jgi:transcriptional regulator with XRE-family HTH domain
VSLAADGWGMLPTPFQGATGMALEKWLWTHYVGGVGATKAEGRPMGGPGSGRRPKPDRRRQILRLRAAGLSLGQIARRLGVTKQLVHQNLMAAGAAGPVAVQCRACGAEFAPVRHTPGSDRAALCLACLAKWPGVPFGERLTSYRLAAGLTQAELARRAGLATSTVSGYERVGGVPREATLARLTRVLGPGLAATGPEGRASA